MFAIIFSIVVLIVGIGLTIFLKSEDANLWRLPIIIAVALAAVFIIASCIAVVPTGYTGILTTFGRVEDRTIASGANFIAPWQKVIKMDNRTQKVELQTSAFSSDIQQVDLKMSVNYCIDQNTAQTLYRTVGENYFETVMFPRIQENVKAVFSQYSAENLIAKREFLSEAIAENTRNDLVGYGITIVSFAVEDIDFTDAFTDAVEAKQVAAQNKLTAETEQAQKTMEAEAAAKRTVIEAQAKADVAKVEADANLYAKEKEAEANGKLGKSLSEEIIRYFWIQRWGGKLPDTMLSPDGNYMLNLG